MKRSPEGILELNWMGKNDALIPVADGKYDYAWVDQGDPRAREVKSIETAEQFGDLDGPTGASENLLIVGDSGDALRSLGAIPEYAERFLGQIRLVYIDPPFNTEQTFEHYADQLEHSIWLTLMRDRIRDIKPLLAENGSVWVHLDDVEMHRMRVPKSRRSSRDLPPPPELAEALRALKMRQKTEALALGVAWSDDRLIAVHEDGTPVRHEWYSDEFQRLRERAGLRRIHLKGLRNTSVSLMLDQRHPVHIVAAWHGHDPTVSLSIYADAKADELRAAGASLFG